MRYERSVSGGRTRPDGEVLKWRITAPTVEKHGRGLLPFFCGDVTDRSLRVCVVSLLLLTHLSYSAGSNRSILRRTL